MPTLLSLVKAQLVKIVEGDLVRKAATATLIYVAKTQSPPFPNRTVARARTELSRRGVRL